MQHLQDIFFATDNVKLNTQLYKFQTYNLLLIKAMKLDKDVIVALSPRHESEFDQ